MFEISECQIARRVKALAKVTGLADWRSSTGVWTWPTPWPGTVRHSRDQLIEADKEAARNGVSPQPGKFHQAVMRRNRSV